MAAMQWFRWHHGTTDDPKWRLVAKRSGCPLPCVVAVWAKVLEHASGTEKRGTLAGWNDEVVAVALDMEPEHVAAIRGAMQGLVLDGDMLTGWSARQPKREDDSRERVRAHRERNRPQQPPPDTSPDGDETKPETTAARGNADVTQSNAPEESREDTEKIPPNPVVPSPRRSRAGARWADGIDLDFERCWREYPKRAGGNSKADAAKQYAKRRSEGVSAEAMLSGTRRYAAYCQAAGKVGTEYVMQAQRFYGKSRQWEDEWEAPAPQPDDEDAWLAEFQAGLR